MMNKQKQFKMCGLNNHQIRPGYSEHLDQILTNNKA